MSAVFTVAYAVVGFAIGLRPLDDNSFMWHVRTGRLILDSGIPHSDPYSFTAHGISWIAQSWLAELWYGVVDNAFGAFGLRVANGVLGAVLGACLFRLAFRLCGDRVRAAGLTLLTIVAVLNVWGERPLMFGLVGFLAVVTVCELPDSILGRRAVWTLPIVMWLWVNVHGTFAIGFVYLALHLAGRAWDAHSLRIGHERKVAIGTAIAAGAVFVNPYFVNLVLFPVHLLGRGKVLSGVEEWTSPNFRALGGMFFGLWVAVAVVMLARKGAPKRDVLIMVVFLLLSLWAQRNIGLTAIAGLPILARAARRGHDEPVSRRDLRSRSNTLVVVALVLAGVLFFAHAANEPSWDLHRYPVAAARTLEQRGLLGHRLFTTDSWGGYMIDAYWPQQHVFLDDRYDMYPVSLVETYDKIADVAPGWDKALDDQRIDVVMWPTDRALTQVLAERKDWVRVYGDKNAVVYARPSLVANPH